MNMSNESNIISSKFKIELFIFLEFKECFYLYARSDHIKTLDELTVIMRSLDLSPTISELAGYFKHKVA